MFRSLMIAVAAAAVVAASAHAQVQGKLTLYTSQPDRDAAQTVEGFRKSAPGVAVEIFRSGTTEVMSKLEAEFAAGSPQADVLLIADAVTMERLKAAGRLLAHAAADVAQFAPEAYDKDRTYFGTKLITTGIVVHNSASIKPQSWADLLKPEAKGQVVLPSPLYSGAAAIHMAALTAVPGLGTEFYEGLAKNGANAVRGNGAVVNAVAGGQKLYGFVVEFMALNAQKKGSPVTFVFPKEGVSAVTEPAAILKATANPAAAKAFIDFLLPKEGQELAVSQGYLPARRDVAPPPGFPNLADVKLIPVNVPAAIAADAASKKKFADLFGG